MVVENIFGESDYAEMSKAFNEIFKRNLRPTTKYKNYGATVHELRASEQPSFGPLLCPEWLDLICNAMGVQTNLEVAGALHAHPAGSQDGWVHNDYNPAWFSEAGGTGKLMLGDQDQCNYRTGAVTSPSIIPTRRVRHLALIYYLNNDAWQFGDGGETALYGSISQGVENADVLVPPKNNSLLVFECSPHSWHSFRRTAAERNSIAMWTHRTPTDAKQQWPHHDTIDWA